jgi:hypothetical protein
MMPDAIGLFLGAGASYELGMPLVMGLTEELRAILTDEHVRTLMNNARGSAAEINELAVNDFLSVFSTGPMHYEAVLGYLQIQSRRKRELLQDYAALAGWLTETVYLRLLRRHLHLAAHVNQGLRFIDGIVGLSQVHRPLWVFSLNHDCVIECLAAANNIAISAGLVDRSALALRSPSGSIIGELPIETISGTEFNEHSLRFFEQGTVGINLFKIHGGLEMFTANDGKDLVRLLPMDEGPQGVLDSLTAANTQLRLNTGMKAPTTNIIMCDDANDNTVLLNRSILAGAVKFDGRGSQVIPNRYLDIFDSALLWVKHLICIGYGFGDLHINAKLRWWLDMFDGRSMTIVAPGIQSVPAFLAHVTPQVEIVDATATTYLQQFSPSPLTVAEDLAKVIYGGVRTWFRDRGDAR